MPFILNERTPPNYETFVSLVNLNEGQRDWLNVMLVERLCTQFRNINLQILVFQLALPCVINSRPI